MQKNQIKESIAQFEIHFTRPNSSLLFLNEWIRITNHVTRQTKDCRCFENVPVSCQKILQSVILANILLSFSNILFIRRNLHHQRKININLRISNFQVSWTNFSDYTVAEPRESSLFKLKRNTCANRPSFVCSRTQTRRKHGEETRKREGRGDQ